MNSRLYIIFSILFFILSILIILTKGYFAVARYDVERLDISNFLQNQNKTFNNFLFVSNAQIKEKILLNFEDIEDVLIEKNYMDFSIKINLVNKTPQFKTNTPNMYIDSNGKIFKSNSDYKLNLVNVDITSISATDQIFEKEEVEFIKKLVEYPNFNIICKTRYFEIRYTERTNFYIEVYKISEYLKLSESLNSEIKKLPLDGEETVFLVLDNRIVIKK
ncbi:hypothetical protein KA001_00365 [Patescibacteria group bacterium]|nr:hypothetical protein [Patescibacteria group bacterium]